MTVGLFHTVTQYSLRKGLCRERGSFPQQLHHFTVPFPEEVELLRLQLEEVGPLSLSAGGLSRLLNGALHVSFTWNINQGVRGRSMCLFDFGGHRDSCKRSENNLIYLRGCVAEAGGFVARFGLFFSGLIRQEAQFFSSQCCRTKSKQSFNEVTEVKDSNVFVDQVEHFSHRSMI